MLTNREAFEKFHYDNPIVYFYLRRFCLELVGKGHRKFGIKLVLERVRWEILFATNTSDRFKINNNHAPFYARLLACEPEFATVFRTRVQRSA